MPITPNVTGTSSEAVAINGTPVFSASHSLPGTSELHVDLVVETGPTHNIIFGFSDHRQVRYLFIKNTGAGKLQFPAGGANFEFDPGDSFSATGLMAERFAAQLFSPSVGTASGIHTQSATGGSLLVVEAPGTQSARIQALVLINDQT